MGPNNGSFGAAAGGVSPELMAALQRRQTGGGATSAVTNGAPTMDPQTQPPMPGGAPVSNPAMGAAPQPGLPMDSSESSIILKALDSRLKAISKIQGA